MEHVHLRPRNELKYDTFAVGAAASVRNVKVVVGVQGEARSGIAAVDTAREGILPNAKGEYRATTTAV
jgi:cytidine deaminase